MGYTAGRLTTVNGPGANFALTYWGVTTIQSPWGSTGYGTANQLQSVSNAAGGHIFEYVPGTGEILAVTLPYGGKITYNWRSFTFTGNRTVREVASRVLQPSAGVNWTYTFTRDDGGDAGLSYHLYTTISQPDGLSDRRWYFTSDRRIWMYDERGPGQAIKARAEYNWANADDTHHENPYIWRVTNRVLAPLAARTRTEQGRDVYNNVVWTKTYDFNDADNARAELTLINICITAPTEHSTSAVTSVIESLDPQLLRSAKPK